MVDNKTPLHGSTEDFVPQLCKVFVFLSDKLPLAQLTIDQICGTECK